jgi:hypothetical protein
VDVLGIDGPADAHLAGAVVAPEGTYEVVVEGPPEGEAQRILVLARVPGHAWGRDVVTVGPEDDVSLDLRVGGPDRAATLKGRVLDLADRAVPGLRLLVTSDWFAASTGVATYDAGTNLPLGAAALRGEAVVTTDAEGRFEVAGLAVQPVWAVAVEPIWHVGADFSGGMIPPDDVTLRARPAFALEGLVTDAVSGEVLATIDRSQEVRVGERSLGHHTMSGPGGRFRWVQPIPPGGERGFEVVLTVVSEGYRRTERTVRFEPGRWSQRVEIPLEAESPQGVGKVRFRHRLADRTGRPLDVTVVRFEAFGGARTGRALRGTKEADGSVVVTVPAGTSTFLVYRPETGGLPLVKWQGDLDVPGGTTTEFAVPFPPTGTVRLRTTKGEPFATVHAEGPDGKGLDVATIPPGTDEVEIGPLPVGRWRFWLLHRGEEQAVAVDVAEGAPMPAVLVR